MFKPTKKEVINALERVEKIEIPYGSEEGDVINRDKTYESLSDEDKDAVRECEKQLYEYTRSMGDVNKRSITELNKAHYNVSLGQSQDDPDRLVGEVALENGLILDISDKY